MNLTGVEDTGRLSAIEQRLNVVEQSLGIPSPPPVQAENSGPSARVRVQSAEYVESEGATSR